MCSYLLEIREHVVKEIIDAEGILDVVKLIPQPRSGCGAVWWGGAWALQFLGFKSKVSMT